MGDLHAHHLKAKRCFGCGYIHITFVEHLKGHHAHKWTDLISLVLAFFASICLTAHILIYRDIILQQRAF
jgi:hypothetical protein